MEPPKEFDETEVALHLLGSIAEQVDAVKRLDREYRARVFAHLRAHYPGLLAQDIEACYRAAIADFAAQLVAYHRAEKTSFDPDQPLLPFLKIIAFRRAADFRRRCCAQEKASKGLSEAIASAGGFVAREGPRLTEREEFRAVVREAVAGLPGQQQIVWGAIVDLVFKTSEMPGDEELRAYLSEQGSEPWTIAAVRGGKRNGKEALRNRLKSKGYDIDW